MKSQNIIGRRPDKPAPPLPENLRVAIYAGMFIKDFDGATKTLFELIGSLQRKRAKIAVWSFSRKATRLPGVLVNRVAAVSLPFYPDYRFSFPGPTLLWRLRKFKPDVIHLTVPDAVGMAMAAYAKIKGIPLLISYHTDFVSYLEENNLWLLVWIWWPILRWFYNQADILLVPSRNSAAKLARHGIQSASLWRRGLPDGCFSPAFRSDSLRRQWKAEGRKVILFSGRFAWFKGLQVFVKVYELFKNDPGISPVFVLLGRGPEEEEIRRRMPDAIFPGYLTGNELSVVYASSDLLLFPSTTETFGNVIQEAMASGLPSVVSDEGGCQEIVREAGGGLVAKARDGRSFYAECRRLLTDDDLYRRMREAGLRSTENLQWDAVNQAVLDSYARLVSRR